MRITKGFTYIEILLALIILSVALIPLLSQFYIGLKGNEVSRYVTVATNLAEDLMEEIRKMAFEDPQQDGIFGIEADEITVPQKRITFDDVDDYHGWERTPPEDMDGVSLTNDLAAFTRKVTVSYAILVGDKWVVSANPTDFKMVTVTVSHREIQDVELVSLAAKY